MGIGTGAGTRAGAGAGAGAEVRICPIGHGPVNIFGKPVPYAFCPFLIRQIDLDVARSEDTALYQVKNEVLLFLIVFAICSGTILVGCAWEIASPPSKVICDAFKPIPPVHAFAISLQLRNIDEVLTVKPDLTRPSFFGPNFVTARGGYQGLFLVAIGG